MDISGRLTDKGQDIKHVLLFDRIKMRFAKYAEKYPKSVGEVRKYFDEDEDGFFQEMSESFSYHRGGSV